MTPRHSAPALVASACLVVCVARPAVAQGQANRLYGEALGAGIVYSINYERQLTKVFGLRIGVSGWPVEGVQYATGLGMLHASLGGGRHRAVFGVGGAGGWYDVDLFETGPGSGGYLILSAGYELRPTADGLFLRISYTPLFRFDAAAPLWGGLSIGWQF